MVLEIRELLRQGPFTLSQLAGELCASREVVRASLQFWMARGDVRVDTGRRMDGACAMHGCGSCIPATPGAGPAVYLWEEEHGQDTARTVGES